MRGLVRLFVASLVACSCGGRSNQPDDGDGNGGASAASATGGAAGTTSGAAGTTSGAAGAAGSATGGSTGGSATGGGGIVIQTGGSAGLGAQGGTAGSPGGSGGYAGDLDERLPTCLKSIDPGPCDGALARYAFNPATLACEPFVYGGCQGNDNNFETLEACETTCVETLPDGCDAMRRALGCPCTDATQCTCSTVEFELTGQCAPSPVGYCTYPIGEGQCICDLDGSRACGV